MEYHWYEDYWAMPRNLPKGHQFFIGLPDATGKTIPCGEYPHGSVGVFVYMVAG